jgi:hypothetical protein
MVGCSCIPNNNQLSLFLSLCVRSKGKGKRCVRFCVDIRFRSIYPIHCRRYSSGYIEDACDVPVYIVLASLISTTELWTLHYTKPRSGHNGKFPFFYFSSFSECRRHFRLNWFLKIKRHFLWLSHWQNVFLSSERELSIYYLFLCFQCGLSVVLLLQGFRAASKFELEIQTFPIALPSENVYLFIYLFIKR